MSMVVSRRSVDGARQGRICIAHSSRTNFHVMISSFSVSTAILPEVFWGAAPTKDVPLGGGIVRSVSSGTHGVVIW